MYALTSFDAVYLYLKIAHDVLTKHGGTKKDITNGTHMYEQAKNYQMESSKYCYFPMT